MTLTDTIHAAPRIAVDTSLRLVRLPLTVAGQLSGQGANEQWPPALAFEGFEASVETVVGSILRDEALVEKGRIRQAKVAELRKAAYLQTVAEQQRENATQTLQERREKAAADRQEAERKAQQRDRELEQQAQRKQKAAQEKAERKASAARKAKAARDEAITKQERSAKAAALAEEAKALDLTEQAIEEQRTVETINETLEGTKEARRTG
jgi:hypothetical protein